MRPLAELIGDSPGLAAIREQIGRLLQRPPDSRRLPAVLIQGETGTGKGLLARAIHRASPRAAGPFVDVNCAAIPETLLESEMFGFERGAFTDARQAKAGLFQAAHRGTIFLDEVGLLPEGLQAKLLTVIEEHTVRRLGSTRSEPVDAWVLAATSEDLLAATRARRFREDLYHRLAVLTVRLPPLRERGEDILLLAEHFLGRACTDYALSPKSFTSDARAALLTYPWPGNIRELANVMERVVLLTEVRSVTAALLGLPTQVVPPPREPERRQEAAPPEEAAPDVQRQDLLEALQQTNWNVSQAAARLGISRNTLRYRIEKYGLHRTGHPAPPGPRQAQPPAAAAPAAPVAPAAAGAVVAGLRWEPRPLTLLRAALVAPEGEPLPPGARRALEVVVEKVRGFGGRVEELTPRGIVATFGVEPAEDAPSRAAHAAMAIQKAGERARRADPNVVGVTVAIHTSQFMVGRLEGTAQLDQDGKRDAWAVLEELLERAGSDTIVVSDATAPLLERRFDLVPVVVLERAPGRAYRLTGRERTGLELGRRMARFVGRQHELALLRSQLASAMRGDAQVVGIAGEPGIGKSRLLFEFRQGLVGERVSYLEGHCVSYGTGIPYLPVLDILRGAFLSSAFPSPVALPPFQPSRGGDTLSRLMARGFSDEAVARGHFGAGV
ncbi:MAG: sigma 54-interacting transcriptional regulator, partial [Candidatus Rokubacteria bacterium]|nr:sigma 54-interacting transcriptional regulator [Candidatus Rokubacteria bacterium]